MACSSVLGRISEDVIKLHNTLVQLLIKASSRRGLIAGDTLSQVSREPHRRKTGGIIRPRNSSRTFAASRVSMGSKFVSDKFQPSGAAPAKVLSQPCRQMSLHIINGIIDAKMIATNLCRSGSHGRLAWKSAFDNARNDKTCLGGSFNFHSYYTSPKSVLFSKEEGRLSVMSYGNHIFRQEIFF